METNNTPTQAPSEPSVLQTFNNLYPSLVQCFAIILLGYITARLGYISPTSSKGIGVFVSMVALPSLLFQSMVKLDFSQVNWPFLCSILVSKSVVFFTVMLFTLALVRPTNLGKAGIYPIFSVQSNDFALGYPLLKAMYQDLHPDFIQYVYLIAPVSLVCLNPIGFILMEIHKHRSKRESFSKCKVAIATVKGVVFNPIVFMTFIGILGNFIFSQKMPAILDSILGALGQAFLASALFFLGVKMVGSMTTKMGPGLMIPMLLIAAKVLLLPLVTREAIQLFDVGKSRNDTEDWSMFGFLYGTFPTAPTVAIFATKFEIEEQLMTSSMVMCTFLSAPIMFMSAQMSVLGYVSQDKINNFLKDSMVDISSISIPFGVWVIAMFCLARRHRVYPYNFTLYLVVCQLLVCVSTLLLSLIQWNSKYWILTEFTLYSFACWGSRCWTAMVALSLYLVRCKGDQAVSRVRVWIHLFGWGVPLFSCGIVIALVDNGIDVEPGSFLLSNIMTKMPTQICAMVLMLVCVIITITSLVRLQRFDRYCKCPKKRPSVANQGDQEETPQNDEKAERCSPCIKREQQTDKRTIPCCQTEDPRTPTCTLAAIEIESLDESTCLVQKGRERTLYTEEADSALPCEILGKDLSVDEYLQGGKHQLGRHVTMLLILLISMVMALFRLFWDVLQEDTSSGIYIAIQTVDAFCILGQSFVVFACFGLEKQLVIIPFLKRWRKLWYGVEGVPLPNIQDLDPAIVQLCDRFRRYHKQRCQQLLVSDKRILPCKNNSVFRGDELVNWLLEVGLATDRHAAVHYGNCLILGRIIRHGTDAHFFYDSPYLYAFC